MLHDPILPSVQPRLQEVMSVAEDESVLTRAARAPDQVIAYGPGPQQTVELRHGSKGGERPLLVIIHGGFWRPDIDRAHAGPMADALALQGWSVALPEYSRVPGAPVATLDDLTLLLRQCVRWSVPHNRNVVLIGHSAGGHLVLWATAARLCPALTGTLGLAPVADLALAHALNLGDGAVARFLGGSPAQHTDIDPARMPPPPTATTIVHGTQDVWVPLAISESYLAAQTAARLTVLPGAGHFALIDPLQPAWSVVTAELTRFGV